MGESRDILSALLEVLCYQYAHAASFPCLLEFTAEVRDWAPALVFLLAAPALSIPSLLGISRVVGWKIPVTYAILMAITGIAGGLIFPFFVPSIILR